MDPLSDLDSNSSPSNLLRVALWLEDPLVQAGLMVLLEGAEGVEVVPEDDSDVAVILWDADAASELAPPLTAGQPPVLALVADLERSTALLTRGVAGVLSRRSFSAGLAAGLRAVSAGLLVVPRGSLDALLPRLPEAVANLPLDPLTARELEVLGLVAEGLNQSRRRRPSGGHRVDGEVPPQRPAEQICCRHADRAGGARYPDGRPPHLNPSRWASGTRAIGQVRSDKRGARGSRRSRKG